MAPCSFMCVDACAVKCSLCRYAVLVFFFRFLATSFLLQVQYCFIFFFSFNGVTTGRISRYFILTSHSHLFALKKAADRHCQHPSVLLEIIRPTSHELGGYSTMTDLCHLLSSLFSSKGLSWWRCSPEMWKNESTRLLCALCIQATSWPSTVFCLQYMVFHGTAFLFYLSGGVSTIISSYHGVTIAAGVSTCTYMPDL